MASKSTQSAAGILVQEYTEVTLKNLLESGDLNLKKTKIWEGPPPGDFPKQIPKGEERQFRHYKDHSGGSVGGLEYAVREGSKFDKWIIAWSNPKKEPHKQAYYKVFTQILFEDEDVNWEEIKKALDKSGNRCELEKFSFISYIEINNLLVPSHTPRVSVTATFNQVLIADGRPESKA